MHNLIPALLETTAAAVFLVPIFLYLHRKRFHNARTTAASVLLSLYLCTVYTIAGLPNILYVRFDPNFNFIPFRYFFTDFSSLLNVFLFIPLGMFLPVLRSKFRSFFKTLAVGLATSAFIELMQIFTYRATDVNDLMTNSLGTIIGFWAGMLLIRLFPGITMEEDPGQIRIIFAVSVLVMFLLQPFISSLFWTAM